MQRGVNGYTATLFIDGCRGNPRASSRQEKQTVTAASHDLFFFLVTSTVTPQRCLLTAAAVTHGRAHVKINKRWPLRRKTFLSFHGVNGYIATLFIDGCRGNPRASSRQDKQTVTVASHDLCFFVQTQQFIKNRQNFCLELKKHQFFSCSKAEFIVFILKPTIVFMIKRGTDSF